MGGPGLSTRVLTAEPGDQTQRSHAESQREDSTQGRFSVALGTERDRCQGMQAAFRSGKSSGQDGRQGNQDCKALNSEFCHNHMSL